MWRRLTEPLDELAIRSACTSVRVGEGPAEHLEEAQALLADPDFLWPRGVPAAEPEFFSQTGFRFRSLVSSASPENDVVWGRFFRAGKDWRQKPAVLLVHGWNGELGYIYQFPFLARLLARRGVNAAMIELPYHAHRRPKGLNTINNFISHDLLCMLSATRQAIADCRAMMGWVQDQGSPRTGIWGISLGAWLAGLVTVTEPRTAFTVLMSPVVRLDYAIRDLPFCEPIRQSLAGRNFDVGRLNLLSHSPYPKPDNILIIESIHDLFAKVATIEELWRAWDRPHIWRLAHGHISILMSLTAMLRTVRWVRQK
jgi:hypothetical protein